MDCIECKAQNPDGARYCNQCGAELGLTINATIRKRDLRDRRATETEIAEAIFERVLKWSKWAFTIIAIAVVSVFGLSYASFREAVKAGQQKIQDSVTKTTQDVEAIRAPLPGLKKDVDDLETQIQHYREVNQRIDGLQKTLFKVQNDVIDLGKHKVKASSIELTGPGPGNFYFGELGCGITPPKGILFCESNSSQPVLFQVSSKGNDLRPVSSRSTIGFQDLSNGPKPTCTDELRGLIYVEKGTPGTIDKPFLCVRKPDNTHAWLQLSTGQ